MQQAPHDISIILMLALIVETNKHLLDYIISKPRCQVSRCTQDRPIEYVDEKLPSSFAFIVVHTVVSRSRQSSNPIWYFIHINSSNILRTTSMAIYIPERPDFYKD